MKPLTLAISLALSVGASAAFAQDKVSEQKPTQTVTPMVPLTYVGSNARVGATIDSGRLTAGGAAAVKPSQRHTAADSVTSRVFMPITARQYSPAVRSCRCSKKASPEPMAAITRTSDARPVRERVARPC